MIVSKYMLYIDNFGIFFIKLAKVFHLKVMCKNQFSCDPLFIAALENILCVNAT